MIIGLLGGAVPFFACTKLKSWFHYDDALDTFGVHAVGGTLGAFLTGLLATAAVNGSLTGAVATQNGLAHFLHARLWLEQLKAMGITIALALTGTFLIAIFVRSVIGLRIAPEIERQGLDINVHGEEGYITSG
jgi:ammonium transporter, Amt family